MTIRFVLNGAPVAVDADDAEARLDPHVTLLEWLRASGKTGSKEGCAEGECGACAVAFVAEDAQGRPRFEPVNSCLVPLWTVDGREVVTVEGVAGARGELHPVQEAMVERGGSQCGYCTPGFVVSLFCEYYRPGRAGYDPEAIGGNLCRCTGYRPIADVARGLPYPKADDPWISVLEAPRARGAGRADGGGSLLEPTALLRGARFVRPLTLAGLFDCMAEWPDAVLLAGGTDLMVYANQRYERWPKVIALDAIPELARYEETPDAIVIGAGVPLARIEERLAAKHDGEAESLEVLLPLFSSRLIRNRATLGGSLATASPIGDAAPVLLALDATLALASASGTRRVALSDFFLGYRKTVLVPGEVIVSVTVPRPMPECQRFYKVSKRVMDDISTVAGAFALDRGVDGRVQRLRAAYGGIGATPVRAVEVETRAIGRPWNAETLALLAPEIDRVGTPMSDHRGSAAYRRAVARKLFERFFFETNGLVRAPRAEDRP